MAEASVTVSFKCIECGWKGEFNLPKKTSPLVFADRQNCPHCKLDASLRPMYT